MEKLSLPAVLTSLTELRRYAKEAADSAGIDEARSYQILNSILSGDMLSKPGWIRLSVHPTMTNAEVNFLLDAIELTVSHFEEWASDYIYDHDISEYTFKGIEATERGRVEDWFDAGRW